MSWLFRKPPWFAALTGTPEDRENFDWAEWSHQVGREALRRFRFPLAFGVFYVIMIGWQSDRVDVAITQDQDRAMTAQGGAHAPEDYAHTSANNPWAKARD